MEFELFCMGLIALLFGLAVVFGGYRMFLFLLPIWGFFFGLALGAQTIQIIFDVGFLVTVTSWVVGFIVGVIFAVLSYLFYFVAVALLAGGFGYALAVGLLGAIGLDFGLITWIIGIIVAVAVAALVIFFNIQKYAVIVITAMAGSGVIIFTLLAAFGDLSPLALLLNPVKLAIQNSFWWLIFFLVLAGAGVFVQIRSSMAYEIEDYNRIAA